jgi:polyisoprenoid-binding protein YceI
MGSRRLIIDVAALAAAGVLAFGGWYAFLRGDGPAPVSLDTAVQGLQPSPTAPRATAAVTAATTAAPSTATPAVASKAAPGGASTWSVDGASSLVGYRAKEELSGIGANTAVGRTSTVTGQLQFDGKSVSALQVTADLRNLRSDESRRDNFLRQQGLETNRFPEATFALAEPIAVTVPVAEGATMAATAKGDLTVHGVTKRVDFPVEGKLSGGKLVVVGSMHTTFADFNMTKPRVPLVLSIDDDLLIELSLVFVPSGG